MLHWQVPKLLSRISLEARVIFCSTLLHLFLLIALFVVYQGAANFNVTISGNMINPDAEIVFMPLHRSIKQPTSGSKSGSTIQTNASKKSHAAQSEKSKEIASGTTLVKIIQPKAKTKSTQPTPKATAGREKESKKAEAKKALDAKNEKATQPTAKATAGTEKEASAKKDTKIEDKASIKKDKLEAKVEEKKAAEAAPDKTSEVKGNNNVTSASSSAAAGSSDTSNIVYVGQEEMDSLQAQEYIQQELAQHWAPPAGMRSDLFAVITLTIDFDGVIKQVELTQASGNLLFDTAAKKAAAHITPARWTYGKKLAITFKP